MGMSKSTRNSVRRSEPEKSTIRKEVGVLKHDALSKRFTLPVEGGHEAILDYDRVESNNALTFDLYHTEVPEALRGKGIGKVLARRLRGAYCSAPRCQIDPQLHFLATLLRVEQEPLRGQRSRLLAGCNLTNQPLQRCPWSRWPA